MKIAIMGAGNVGGALGAGLSEAGHEVTFGVRDPASEKARAAVRVAKGSQVTGPSEAIDDAEVVIFALRWDAARGMVGTLTAAKAGDRVLDGRVVIDAMNRFGGDPTRSTAQDLAELLPGARVVKAFNTVGFENMAGARGRRQKAAMFIAGDHPEANAVAASLAADLGFQPEDVGGLENAKPLEEMVKIWLALAQRHGRGVAFAISDS